MHHKTVQMRDYEAIYKRYLENSILKHKIVDEMQDLNAKIVRI